MRLPEPLIPARLIRRYQRFLMDAELEDGQTVVAHCANSGSMLGLLPGGAPILLSQAADPRRRTAWNWELLRLPSSWVAIHTGRTNHLVAEALDLDQIPELTGYPRKTREATFQPGSRLDFRLQAPQRPDCWLEVKSVTLRQGDGAQFPDAITQRGWHHLQVLAAAAERGERAVLLFVVQREDCPWFAPADAIDPRYGQALRMARAAGVEVLVYGCRIEPPTIILTTPIPCRF